MAWFWKKQQEAAAAAPATAAVDAAVADAQRNDKEWRRQAARLEQEEKRRAKAVEREAKRALKEMKRQAKLARKERAKAEKTVKKQARAVLQEQRKGQKQERKRAKVLVKLRRSEEKRRKRVVRHRKKEEKRRRKQLRQEDSLVREREQAEAETETLRTISNANLATAAAMAVAVDGVVPVGAPKFKEDKRCKSCYLQFQRLPTRRRHHCRNCGESFCSKCLSGVKRPIPWFKLEKPQKVCFSCDVHVFNGMVHRPNGETALPVPAAASRVMDNDQPMAVAVASPQVQSQNERSPSLRAQRSASFESEQPEDDSPRASPASRSRLAFRRRPRSRRDGTTPKNKKNSLWSLPIRPLLKRKASADQLRNRSWDFDLRLEKEEMLARQRKSQMVAVSGAPQFAQAS